MLALLLLPFVAVGYALFGAIIRQSQRRGGQVLFIGATNYVVAALVNAGLALAAGRVQISGRTAALAVASGLTYAIGFRLVNTSMERRGLAVPSAVMRLSVIVPLGFSVAWGERPAMVQVVGIALALGALTLLAGDRVEDAAPSPLPGGNAACPQSSEGATAASLAGTDRLANAPAAVVLALLFLLQGGASLAPKAFNELCPAGESRAFLALLFATAALTFLPEWLGAARPRRQDLTWGVTLGAVNAASNLLSVYLLSQLPGILVYPVETAGTLLLTAGLGLIVWREPLGRRGRLGMAVALGAAVLVGIGG